MSAAVGHPALDKEQITKCLECPRLGYINELKAKKIHALLEWTSKENTREMRMVVSKPGMKYLGVKGLCGEGNGTPLQYSCLENPMDGGAW